MIFANETEQTSLFKERYMNDYVSFIFWSNRWKKHPPPVLCGDRRSFFAYVCFVYLMSLYKSL